MRVHFAFTFILFWVAACAAPSSAPTPTIAHALPSPTAAPTIETRAPTVAAIFYRQPDIANLVADDANLFFSTCKPAARAATATPDDLIAKIGKNSGRSVTLAPNQACPGNLLADASNLYWTSRRVIWRGAKNGDAPTQLFASENEINGMSQDADFLYASGCDLNGKGTLQQIAKANGATKIVATDARCARIIAADAANFYLIISDRDAGDELYRLKKTGGAFEKIVTLARYPVVVSRIASDERAIYWTTRQDAGKPQGDADDYNSILALNTDSATIKAMANQQPRPSALTMDAVNLYWSNCGTARFNFENAGLMRAAKSGGAAVPIAPGICATELAVDGANVYAVTKEGIVRVGK
ncbi:MAG: hypothetical protein HY327_14390 [Chloroflexi bacterium]|nr:hypothetical protein [Chloroflexota bacterium]